MELSVKFYDIIEKGTRAMNSMAKAQKDMEDFQRAWKDSGFKPVYKEIGDRRLLFYPLSLVTPPIIDLRPSLISSHLFPYPI